MLTQGWALEGYGIAVRAAYMTNASTLEQNNAAPSNVAQAIGLGAQLRCKKGSQLVLPPVRVMFDRVDSTRCSHCFSLEISRQGYVDSVRAITRERIAIAGYRLAAVLEKLYDKYRSQSMFI